MEHADVKQQSRLTTTDALQHSKVPWVDLNFIRSIILSYHDLFLAKIQEQEYTEARVQKKLECLKTVCLLYQYFWQFTTAK